MFTPKRFQFKLSPLLFFLILTACGGGGSSEAGALLEAYEKQVVEWEEKAKTGDPITPQDIQRMNAANQDIAEKAAALMDGDGFSKKERERYTDLATRYAEAMNQLATRN